MVVGMMRCWSEKVYVTDTARNHTVDIIAGIVDGSRF